MTTQIETALQKIKEIIQGTMYEADYDKIREVLQSLQPTEEREVKVWRCNCEGCKGHNIKYEYKYCPDCGGKIVD